VVVALAGCRAVSSGVEAGADRPELAVHQFLSAARAQDLQAMSAVWGNDVAPVRDRIDRQELEQRLLIIACHLRHDDAQIGIAQRAPEGRTLVRADLTQGTKTAGVNFLTIRNTTTGRWFVDDIDLRPVREFCSSRSPSGGGA
jgi:hypothetical protein